MTWKEFKDAVEELGVKDDTPIDWIDCGTDVEAVEFVENEDGSISVEIS